MTSLRKIAASVTLVAVIGGAAILWPAYEEKATERKLAEAARVRAEQGDANAQYRLGNMYAQGQGVPRDYAEAVGWYRKAADQGYAKAHYGLCYMYGRGQGVPQDSAEAVRWCRKAAEQGDRTAQYVLGLRYIDGEGVPQDYSEAAAWYRKAAEQGDAAAQYALGFSYYRGQGVPQDSAEAVRWYRKAAEQADRKAQGILTVIYFKGQGVPKDYIQAIRWLGKLAASCFGRAEGPLARWTSIAIVLLGVPIVVVPQRRWGRARWLPSAVSSALCAAMLAHELSPSSVAGMVQLLIGEQYRGFSRVLWLALFASGSAIFAIRAVVEVGRGSKRGGDQGQPTPPEGPLHSLSDSSPEP